MRVTLRGRRFLGTASAMFLFGLSTIAFAQDGGEAVVSGVGAGVVAIGAALAMGLSALGGTLGQGKAATAALEGIARNPGSKDQVFAPLILSLALIEFQTILGFIIAILCLTLK